MTEARLQLSHMRLGDPPADIDDGVLYCDPLTSLVAYPSFEQYLVRVLPEFLAGGLHLAIGDVDGLREYVSERRATDPHCFGHLAGNACMRLIGRQTARWAGAELDAVSSICGTFGGDEVIIGASGLDHRDFTRKITTLAQMIRGTAPRPCSFAVATFTASSWTVDDVDETYRRIVSTVDARLFHEKESARSAGPLLDGAVIDLGVMIPAGAKAPAHTNLERGSL